MFEQVVLNICRPSAYDQIVIHVDAELSNFTETTSNNESGLYFLSIPVNKPV